MTQNKLQTRKYCKSTQKPCSNFKSHPPAPLWCQSRFRHHPCCQVGGGIWTWHLQIGVGGWDLEFNEFNSCFVDGWNLELRFSTPIFQLRIQLVLLHLLLHLDQRMPRRCKSPPPERALIKRISYGFRPIRLSLDVCKSILTTSMGQRF